MKAALFVFVSIFLLQSSFSEIFDTSSGRIKLEIPKGLDSRGGNILGANIWVVATDWDKRKRSSINFTVTPSKLSHSPNYAKESMRDYQQGRKVWAKKNGAKITKFIKYKGYLVNKKTFVHETGFEYIQENEKHVSITRYIECSGKTIFSKELSHKDSSLHRNKFLETVKSINCLW